MSDTGGLQIVPPEPPLTSAHASRLSPLTATPRQRLGGLAIALSAPVSSQFGASFGAMAFPVMGPVGVVAVRQLMSALVLAPLVRPDYRSFRAEHWRLSILQAVIFSIMNLSIYLAVERIGLGLAVTLEFLGPLTVAVLASRRMLDFGSALLAAVGVVVLTNPGPSSDLLGISFALLAAVAWGSYVLVSRSLGQLLPGVQGFAAASTLSAIAWIPIAIWWFSTHPPTLVAMGFAIACGIFSSLIPYALDLLALRRIPTNVFGTLASFNPVWAAVAGFVVLGQHLSAHELIGMALIVLANAGVSIRGIGAPPRSRFRGSES